MTITVAAADAPAGAVCRIYRRDNSEFLGETVSDGSGALVFSVSDQVITDVQVETVISGIDGVTLPSVIKLVIE